MSEKGINENNIQDLQERLNQAELKKVRAEDYLNTDDNVETEAAIQERDKFIENHQQAYSNKKMRKKKSPKNCRWNTILQCFI
jgi:hypothetical protein